MPVTMQKTQAEIKSYSVDYSDLLAAGETISTSAWVRDKDLVLTVNSPAATKTNTTTTVWLASGTTGETYTVTNTITTSGGKTLQQSFLVNIAPTNLL